MLQIRDNFEFRIYAKNLIISMHDTDYKTPVALLMIENTLFPLSGKINKFITV